MDVDRSAAAENESIIAEPASPAERTGIADGDGVGIVDVMGPPPGPPPGTWAQTWEAPPTWFAGAVQASVEVAMIECMNTMVIPLIEKSVHSALKRSREDTPLWNGGHAPTKKPNAGGEWPSRSSKWQAPACTWCYGHFNETETLDWKKCLGPSVDKSFSLESNAIQLADFHGCTKLQPGTQWIQARL